MKGFKKCKNGHYYKEELASCPYCPAEVKTENPPARDIGGGQSFDEGTQVYAGNTTTGGKTRPVSDTDVPKTSPKQQGSGGGTLFIDETVKETERGVEVVLTPRHSRRLVGWLVSYTIDNMGVDFKLYEGRNSIGRDADCQITLQDGTVSGEHAILLFRSDKYSITDRQSAHGTFVNDEDIDLEPRYLKDGDIIRVGQTTFKFRSSL